MGEGGNRQEVREQQLGKEQEPIREEETAQRFREVQGDEVEEAGGLTTFIYCPSDLGVEENWDIAWTHSQTAISTTTICANYALQARFQVQKSLAKVRAKA